MNVYGALGQSAPSAATLTDTYTVPTAKHATVRVIACNRGSETIIRVAVAPDGASDATTQYLAYDLVLPSGDAISSVPFTVGDGDVVRCYSASGSVSFTVTGIEQDD